MKHKINLSEKQKLKVLDYAIDRINQYDSKKAKNGLGGCDMCSLVDHYCGSCGDCPFYDLDTDLSCSNHHKDGAALGSLARLIGTNHKQHQKILIERTKKWCKNAEIDFTIEEVK